jgi:nitrous oxide reductase accessory protein NosL
MNRLTLVSLSVAFAALIPACRRAEVSGPPNLRLGHDECAGCGMLVSEDRCSCALLIDSDEGRTHLIFDDLGCLLDYRSDHPGRLPIDTFVHDYGTARWVRAGAASFLHTVPERLATPMSSAMVAFESRDSAERQQMVSGGEVVDYNRLDVLRREWRAARRAGPSGSP